MGSEGSFESTPEMEWFLCERLLDQRQPISERFRALLSLRNLRGTRPSRCPHTRFSLSATWDSSNLLAHKAAFALGQMQDTEAILALEEVLKDVSLHPITHHEAAEALVAVRFDGVIPLLEKSMVSNPALEVKEACELALQRIREQDY